MTDRPEEFRYAAQYGTVLRVHPKAWEVDVRLDSGGIVNRAIVLGHRLPEKSKKDRPQWVEIYFTRALQGQAIALPVDSRLPGGRYALDELVYLMEVQGWKITIMAPGNQGDVVESQTGIFELRSEKGSRVLQFRILEAEGVIELRSPNNSIVMNDDAGSITAKCTKDATIDAGQNVTVKAGKDIGATAGGNISAEAGGNVSVDAGGNISATAGGKIDLTAPNINLTGIVKVTGRLDVV